MTERSDTRQQTGSGAAAPPPATSQGDGAETAPGVERRRNPRLRELVDEMLASVRVAARQDLWTEAERKQYEAELADIMRRVRFEAVWKGGPRDDARDPATDAAGGSPGAGDGGA